jgi:hypothetical protein
MQEEGSKQSFLLLFVCLSLDTSGGRGFSFSLQTAGDMTKDEKNQTERPSWRSLQLSSNEIAFNFGFLFGD